MNDKELNKEIAEKTIVPYYFIDGNLKNGFEINLESQNINHANCLLFITPIYQDFVIVTRNINKILKKWLLFTLDYKINMSLNIICHFQQAFIRLTKKIREVMKLNYSLI